MLRKGINLFVVLLIICACKSSKIMNDQAMILLDVDKSKYGIIHHSIQDTLSRWTEFDLTIAKYYSFKDWKLDELILFSNDSTRLVTSINKKSSIRASESCDVSKIFGVKIENDWYYYLGGTTVMIHSSYQDSTYAPFTFEELSYLSQKHVLGGFFNLKLDGSIVSKEEKFNKHSLFPQKTIGNNLQIDEEKVKNYVVGYYKKRISEEEKAEIYKEQAESVRPPEPPKDPNAPVKLFESEAWKNRVRK